LSSCISEKRIFFFNIASKCIDISIFQSASTKKEKNIEIEIFFGMMIDKAIEYKTKEDN